MLAEEPFNGSNMSHYVKQGLKKLQKAKKLNNTSHLSNQRKSNRDETDSY